MSDAREQDFRRQALVETPWVTAAAVGVFLLGAGFHAFVVMR